MAKQKRFRHARGRANKKVRDRQHSQAQQREALERRWYHRVDFTDDLTSLVVHNDAQSEPYLRWLPYRQGFNPELIRRLLEVGDFQDGPICDPFSGSGTTVLTCADLNVEAIGVEAIPSLVTLSQWRLHSAELAQEGDLESAFAAVSGAETLAQAWEQAVHPLAQAAVLMAAARTVKGDGRPRNNLPPLAELLEEMIGLIREDLEQEFPPLGCVEQGDARQLPMADDSVGGIITSPPYLPRYDYTRVTKPMDRLLGVDISEIRQRQMRAHKRAHSRQWNEKPHAAVEEICQRLQEKDARKSLGMVRNYFDDLAAVVGECARVLQPGAPLCMVIAGALVDKTYVPADLILAEFCAGCGLEVEEILQVRTFGAMRKLGNLQDIAPREVILSARKMGGLPPEPDQEDDEQDDEQW